MAAVVEDAEQTVASASEEEMIIILDGRDSKNTKKCCQDGIEYTECVSRGD